MKTVNSIVHSIVQCTIFQSIFQFRREVWCLHYIFPEGSATKEISYTSWRNQLKSSWNHEKSKQISLKSSSEISPTLQPHPLLQHMMSFLREITGKSNRKQEISYAKIARFRPLDFPDQSYPPPLCLSVSLYDTIFWCGDYCISETPLNSKDQSTLEARFASQQQCLWQALCKILYQTTSHLARFRAILPAPILPTP